MMKIRIVLLAIAAAAGSFLGATHLGNNPLLPGADLHVTITVAPAGDVIVVKHNSADMDAFVDVAVAPPGGDRFSATLENRTPLGITAQANPAGWFLRIYKEGGTSSSEKFTWPNGVAILISRHVSSPTDAVRVLDWEVFPKDNESDAAWKTRRRSFWRWVSLVLMVVTALAAVLTSLVEPKAPPKKAHTARDSVEALIDEITGKDDKETEALRAFLRKRYIQTASLQESLEATGLSPAKARQIAVKSRDLLPERVKRLISDLNGIYVELTTPDAAPANDPTPKAEPPKHG
jgi:hypothetical protein